MDLFFDNWVLIFTSIGVLLGLFTGGVKFKKYFNFAKEMGDIYIFYKKAAKDGWTDSEYTKMGKEVVEFLEAGKVLKT